MGCAEKAFPKALGQPSGQGPPAGPIFENEVPLNILHNSPDFLKYFSSRLLAGVLPSAVQIFEKMAPSKHVK